MIMIISNSVLTGSDHGVKAQGDGWVLTAALIEGSSLVSSDSTGFPDPYVVFTCNGKTRTSSVKLQTPDPQWNGKILFGLDFLMAFVGYLARAL